MLCYWFLQNMLYRVLIVRAFVTMHQLVLTPPVEREGPGTNQSDVSYNKVSIKS